MMTCTVGYDAVRFELSLMALLIPVFFRYVGYL